MKTKLTLNPKTISCLKNFASINPSILFKKGNKISTMAPQKTVLARATLADEFPMDFGIFDLSRFLAVLALFKEPSLSFATNKVKIADGPEGVEYLFSDPETMVTPPDKELELADVIVEFDLTASQLASVMKAAGVLQLPEFVISGNGKDIALKAIDTKNSANNIYELLVGTTKKNFIIVFKIEHMKLMAGDYHVKVSFGKNHKNVVGHFKHKNEDLEYFIAAEANSTSA